MANILINDLNVPGFNLLSGEESYLDEISDSKLDLAYGGGTPLIVFAFSAGYAASVATKKIHNHNKGIIARL